MWPFVERRYNGRFNVDWSASLNCLFPNFRETLQVKVIEFSIGGARLLLERLQTGPFHLVINDDLGQLQLRLGVLEEGINLPIHIQWYNYKEDQGAFVAGVEFLNINEEDQILLTQVLKHLKRGKGSQTRGKEVEPVLTPPSSS